MGRSLVLQGKHSKIVLSEREPMVSNLIVYSKRSKSASLTISIYHEVRLPIYRD
jgi:hypothetical protein